MGKRVYQMKSENHAAIHLVDLLQLRAIWVWRFTRVGTDALTRQYLWRGEKMNTTRIVTSQGARFNNQLYTSDSLKAYVGLRVRLQFDGPTEDRALVICGDSVIEVGLRKYLNPSRIELLLTAAGDSLAVRALELRTCD
jgi:hypothetical protein